MPLTLVTGGTRSGKSAHAERLAAATGLPVRYVATGDPSMADRIAAHVERRPSEWETVEVGESLAAAVGGDAGSPVARGSATRLDVDEPTARRCILVDGLGPWLASRLHAAGAFEDPARAKAATGAILADVDAAVTALRVAGHAIVVAEQAGSGLLPPDAGARAWLDLLGAATERIAWAADEVILVVAGRPFTPTSAALHAPPHECRPMPDLRDAPPHERRPMPDVRHAPPHERRPMPDVREAGVTPECRSVPPASLERDELAALRRHGDRDVRPGDADHAVNVVAGGPPSWLRAALDAALDGDARRYPREDEAVAAIAQHHSRAADEVVPTNGGAEALWLLGPALRPRLAAVLHPQFTEAEAALHAHGVPVTRIHRDPTAGFALDPTAVPDDADLVVVGNPASPSGTLDPAASVLALRRPGRTVVVDEAFMDLVPGEPGSLAREPLDDVIVVRSLTKALSIPGLRAGYALATRPLADRLRAVRPPWSANALALAALTAAAQHPYELHALAERAATERQDLHARLATIDGVHVWPGAANFLLVELPDGPRAVAALREQGIAVRPAASFPGLDDRHVRITARTPDENARLATSLAAALGEARA